MRWFLAIFVSLAAAALPMTSVMGARDPAHELPPQSGFELLVFEADGCTYCELLRRDVAPLYRSAARSKEAPMRFFNVSNADEAALKLIRPITIVPTVVLMRDGEEVDRVTGYTGPLGFVDLVAVMMRRAR